jgi:hypothetical protein
LAVVVGVQLVLVRYVQEVRFLQIIADELHTHGHLVLTQADGNTHAR